MTDVTKVEVSFWTIELLISVWYQLLYTDNNTRDVECAILCFCTPPFFLFFSFPRFSYYSYSYGDSSTTILLIIMLLEAIATSSSSLPSVLPYASECICCWIDCLSLVFINSFSFFFRIIGTPPHCFFKTNKATKRQLNLLLQPPPWNFWCLSS